MSELQWAALTTLFALVAWLRLGGGAEWRARKKLSRALDRLVHTPIAQARDGKVQKLVGRVRLLGEPLRAPITGRPCAYYRVVVRGVDRVQEPGEIAIEESRGQDFLLEDQSGQAIVRMDEAEVAIVADAKFSSGLFHEARPQLEAYLQRHGHTSKPAYNKSIEYLEGVLEAGAEVAVGGLVRLEIDRQGAAAYRESARRAVMRKAGAVKLIVSDDPRRTKA